MRSAEKQRQELQAVQSQVGVSMFDVPLGMDFDKIAKTAKSLQVQEPSKPQVNLWQQHGHYILSRRLIISEKQEIITYCDKELRELNKRRLETEKRIAQCQAILETNPYAKGVRAALEDHTYKVSELASPVEYWTARKETAQKISDAAAKQIAALPVPIAEIEAARKQHELEQLAIESVL